MDTTKEEEDIEGVVVGGCFCGSVRYKVTGDPFDKVAYCCCRLCQRQHSAPAVPWMTVRTSKFAITKGTAKWWKSSEKGFRAFCQDCGTPFLFRYANDEEFIDVAISSLDDPERYPPSMYIWTMSKQTWVHVDPSLEQFTDNGPDVLPPSERSD
eukprot:TRINITY_DN3384_c0_g1_i2.p1 TRINITY_DN3384_c0_g1~~TRINITY_DN3384_c0_g1_i2.p1  ORF type:complete len:154 (+),score=20.19 TRINITY_DN3384_c0_g1_i2:84-545(+)